MIIIPILMAVAISIWIAIAAYNKAGELPDTVSSFAYYVGPEKFTLWVAATAVLLFFPLATILPPRLTGIGALTLGGFLLVGGTPYYRTESSVVHYIGAYVFGICSQIVVAALEPYMLLAWVVFPFLFVRKVWRENIAFIVEALCFLTLVSSLLYKTV